MEKLIKTMKLLDTISDKRLDRDFVICLLITYLSVDELDEANEILEDELEINSND